VLIFYVNKESKIIFDSFVLIFYVNKLGNSLINHKC